MAPPTAAPVLVSLEAVTVEYGARRVLDGVGLGVAGGDRIGVVGRNGDGKSTLLGVLAGRLVPHGGRVAQVRHLAVGVLAQGDDLDATATVYSSVLGTDAEHVWAADPRARDVVESLLGDIARTAIVGDLSGGERRRVALAEVLVRDHDLLLLDEPTNHLDLDAITWLAAHLRGRVDRQRRTGLVVVTHDRWLLDEVCETTWDVHDGTVTAYDGGYAAYVLARAERGRLEDVRGDRRRNVLRKELAWLRRGPPARTSKPKFRIDAANALIADEPSPRDSLALSRLATARLGRKVVELHDVTVVRGGRSLLKDVTVRWGAGDRVGIVGPNGAGKTTLLAIVAGQTAPDEGRVEIGATVRLAVLAQDPARDLAVTQVDPARTVLAAVEGLARVMTATAEDVTPTTLLERFGFVGERLITRVGDLSGGERRRLDLLLTLLGAPNVLLLDEPTNDLDIDTLTVLEDFLDTWPGSLVVVSHDRYFLDRVCDEVYAMPGTGVLTMLPGGVEQYAAQRATVAATPRGSGAPAPSTSVTASTERRPGVSRSSAERRVATKELARLERQLADVTRREGELHEFLASHASDFERLVTLDAELRALVARKSDLEESWLGAAERAEEAERTES